MKPGFVFDKVSDTCTAILPDPDYSIDFNSAERRVELNFDYPISNTPLDSSIFNFELVDEPSLTFSNVGSFVAQKISPTRVFLVLSFSPEEYNFKIKLNTVGLTYEDVDNSGNSVTANY